MSLTSGGVKEGSSSKGSIWFSLQEGTSRRKDGGRGSHSEIVCSAHLMDIVIKDGI